MKFVCIRSKSECIHGDSSDDEEDNFVDDNGDWNDAFDVNLDEY